MRPIDHINRRKNAYLVLVALGFGAMIVLAFAEKYIPVPVFKPILYGALALFGVGNVLLYVGLRCPKCGSMIGYTIVFAGEKVHQCPRCRVSFDEDMTG